MAKDKLDFGDEGFDFEVTTEIIDSGGEEHIPEIEGVSSEIRGKIVATTNNQLTGSRYLERFKNNFFESETLFIEGYEIGTRIISEMNNRAVNFIAILDILSDSDVQVTEYNMNISYITQQQISRIYYNIHEKDEEITEKDIKIMERVYTNIREQIIEKTTN